MVDLGPTTSNQPIYLGIDDTGDQVWQLPNGRWVWGEDPDDAACMGGIRSFEPDRYIEKYGQPVREDEVT